MLINKKRTYSIIVKCFVSIILISMFFVFGMQSISAQFYNGHQMSFGKNRVQYREFLWQFYRFDKFDAYYYVNGKEIAELTAKIAEKEIPNYESFFQYALEKRIIFIVYNKLSDFKQSNIGLEDYDDNNNIGGVTKIVKNKVFLYFDGDRSKFKIQVKAAIVEVILNEMLYGTNMKEKVANSTLIVLSKWYKEGLISYLSNDWGFELEDKVKDGILSGRYENFNRLTGEDAINAGHSIWRYIAKQYGKGIIPNIVYLTRIHKKESEGLLFVLGISFETLSNEWFYYYKSMFLKQNENDITDLTPTINKPKKNVRVTQPRYSPDGKYIAWATNEMGKYKIWLYNVETGKKKRIIRKGHKLAQITDYSFPLIAWHPTGLILSYMIESKGKILLNLYNLETQKTDVVQLFYFEKIIDDSYSDNGHDLVLSAYIKGHSDIWVHNLLSHTNKQITNDYADDFNPRFINNSSQIIFNSNRVENTISGNSGLDIEINKTHDIFIYDYKTQNPLLTQITKTPLIDEVQPESKTKNKYIYLSNKTGVFNRFIAHIDSSISYIDTITHYRKFTVSNPLTNFSRNIREYDFNADGNIIDLFLYGGVDKLVRSDMQSGNYADFDLAKSKYRIAYSAKIITEDSLLREKRKKLEEEKNILDEKTPKEQIAIELDTIIDITNYTFEKEKIGSPVYKNLLMNQKDTETFQLPSPKMYFTAFYPNYLVNQVDFSFLNASYQNFTGGAVYYNPGMNFFIKLGVNELFEDYRLTGGMRISADLGSNEYLISFENLKDRMDKQIIFHRQTFKEIYSDAALKSFTHELLFIRKYPFSQVAAIKGTASIRYDKNVILSTDNTSLEYKNFYRSWAGLKFEYVFDNTMPKGLNLYNGLRFKIFGESFFKIDKEYNDMYILGADFRYYQKIHREIIWASRMAASTSFGKNRLIYYMGSVDNWFSFLSSEKLFNQNVAIDPTQNFVYQALATNMRGFSQNIRNGNSFVLFNNEIRVPIVKYFARRPITNDFFSNLQMIGFFDVGTAWSGATPYSRDNVYNYIVELHGPVTIILNKDIDPVVYGYGFGVRSRLLGYYIRADWAWGIEDYIIQPRIFYLSLSTDF